MPETLANQDVFLLLKWLFVFAVWASLALGLYRDTAKLRKYNDSSIITGVLHLLHKRNLQIYGLTSMLLVVMLGADLNGNADKPVMEKRQGTVKPFAAAPQPSGKEEMSAKQAADKQFPIPRNTAIPFSDITEFNEENSRQQAYIDLLKQRYETWLVTYYYLQKCNKTDKDDFPLIAAALRKELANAHADSVVENNIMVAAAGSYKEMYSDIPCDEAHISSTKAGYDSSMKQITSAATPHTTKQEK